MFSQVDLVMDQPRLLESGMIGAYAYFLKSYWLSPLCLAFQWEISVSKVEKLQGPEAPVAGQDPAQQRHLAGMVHAV